MLDAVLVNGYGAKAAAGWSKPQSTVSNSCSYKQGAAAKAGFTFVLHDNGLVNSWEAKATGWKAATSQTTPVGAGSGQFPLPAQLLTNGCVNIRKSIANNATARVWTIFADARTVYLFVNTGDTATIRMDFGFGEIYSLWGASDTNNCFIAGRSTDSSTTSTAANGGLDRMQTPAVTSSNVGQYLADTYGGNTGSIILSACGDLSKSSSLMSASAAIVAAGALPTPNTSDSAYYLAPMNVFEPSWGLRGRFRGLYHICHPVANVSDGAIITGTGDLAGKSFLVMNPAGAGGMLAIETSNTVDTN